jgi:hypothetical protein
MSDVGLKSQKTYGDHLDQRDVGRQSDLRGYTDDVDHLRHD